MAKPYTDMNRFWEESYPHLREQASLCNLFLGLLTRFRRDPEKCGFAATEVEQENFGAMMLSHFNTENILVPSPTRSKVIVESLIESFFKTEINPTAIVCELETSRLYSEALEARGAKLSLHMKQGVYRCNHVVHPSTSIKIDFREAELADLELLKQWIESFYREAAPADPTMDYERATKKMIEDGRLFVVCGEEGPLSMAATVRSFEQYASVGGVYTPKDCRGRGYGSLVTAQLTQRLLDRGKSEVSLFTDWSNPTSNQIYQRIGYELVGQSLHQGIEINVSK